MTVKIVKYINTNESKTFLKRSRPLVICNVIPTKNGTRNSNSRWLL